MTIFEQEIFNEIAQDYIQQFKNAIETKPVKRKAVRKGKNGSVLLMSLPDKMSQLTMHKQVTDSGEFLLIPESLAL